MAKRKILGMPPALVVWGSFFFLIAAVLFPPLFLAIPIALIVQNQKKVAAARYAEQLRIERVAEAQRRRGY